MNNGEGTPANNEANAKRDTSFGQSDSSFLLVLEH